jgi:hypothetical protein
MNTQTPLPMLNPQLLGEHWSSYHGASSFSVFWRASRLNNLHRRDLRTALHLSLRAGDDVFTRISRGATQHAALRYTYPAAEFVEKDLWKAESWWPFGGRIPFDSMRWKLRVCPVCARSCYHSLLFQMPGVNRCPWHCVELIDACPKCDRPLLADFHGDLPAGRCRCGYDLVNYVATAEGEPAVGDRKRQVIGDYLRWAESSRKHTWLIPSETQDDRAWAALHCLADNSSPGEVLLRERITLERSAKFPICRIGPKSGLESYRPSLVELPGQWAPAFKHIGEQTLAMLPAAQRHNVSEPTGSVRRAFGQLPAYPSERSLYLDSETLDRAVLRCAGQLASILSNPTGFRALVTAGLSHRLREHPLGLRMADSVLRRVMTRGYADGLRVVLGRQVPAMYDSKHSRPVRRLPWILISTPPGAIPFAAIVWTRQPGTF